MRPTSYRASGNPPEVQTVTLHAHELLAHRDVDAPFLKRLKTVRADARLGCSHRGRVPSWLVVRRIVRSRVAVHIMIIIHGVNTLSLARVTETLEGGAAVSHRPLAKCRSSRPWYLGRGSLVARVPDANVAWT